MTASWIEAFPAFLVAAAALLVPGAVVIAPLQLGLIPRLALAGTVSVVCIGVAGVVFGALGASFAAWQVLVVAGCGWALVAIVSAGRAGLRRPSRRRRNSHRILVVWLISGLVLAVVAFAAVPDPARVSQTYDNVFHMSAIASILDGRNASSLSLRTLIETGRSMSFYPAVWHALAAMVVQVAGASPATAVNATWLAVAFAIWLPGLAWLAQVTLRRYPPVRVAQLAMALGVAFGAMPYALLSWGTLYPTFLATALLPAALATAVVAVRETGRSSGPGRWRTVWLAALGLSAALIAIAMAQPRVLVSWALIVAPFLIAAGGKMFRAAIRSGGQARRRAVLWLATGSGALVLVAGAGFAYLVLALDLFERPLEDRLGGPQAAATQSVGEGLWQALTQSWPTGVAGSIAWPAPLLAVVVVVGVVVAVAHRGLRWLVVSYAVVVVLYALAAGSDDVATKLLTALWYKDRYRLSSVLPVLGVVLATLGMLAAVAWMSRRAKWTRRVRELVTGATTGAVVVSSCAALIAGGATAAIGHVFRLPASHAQTAVVSEAQMEFMERLPEIVPEGQRVLGDPWDGSAWSQLFGHREPVFPHVNGQWDEERLVLARRLDAIEEDPAVCAALDSLRVRHVLYNPHEFGGGDPAGNQFAAVHRAVEAGLFRVVTSDGDSTLYEAAQCGPLSPTD